VVDDLIGRGEDGGVGGSTVSAAALVAVVTLAGCGSDPHAAPRRASVAEFCAAGYQFSQARGFDDGLDAARRLRDTGTPKGIPADARRGFELVVGLVAGAKDQGDLRQRYGRLSERQKRTVEALDGYIRKTCAE
jgi:hypothetical protein